MILHKLTRRSLVRSFSNQSKQPIEYKIDEKAFEAQMKGAQDSIAAKLKAIKAQQQSEIKDGEHHVHNPKDFGFISAANKIKDVHGHIYFYNNVNLYQKSDQLLIYKTEPQMHRATAFVDASLSGLFIYASTKVCRNIYLLANGMGWHPFYTLGWGCLGLVQSRYLMDEYLR